MGGEAEEGGRQQELGGGEARGVERGGEEFYFREYLFSFSSQGVQDLEM